MLGSLVDNVVDMFQASNVDWKKIIIVGAIFDFGFKTVLDVLQYRSQCRASPPAEITKTGLIDQTTFIKSQNYSKSKLRFGMFERTISLFQNIAFLKYNLLPKIWEYSKVTAATYFHGGDIVAGIVTMLIIGAGSTVVGLPLDWYHTFVMEKKFGFNKQTFKLWVVDNIKSWVLALILTPPLLAAILMIINYFGRMFVFYLVLFMLVLNVLAMIIYPTIIAPIFNKYEPLEDGELKTAIENLAASQSFPLGRIYVVDGSTRSTHSNAYFIGLPWYKQIVLYDTLISENTSDEIVAVLSHELGHWKRNHIPFLLASGLLNAGLNFAFLGLFLDNASFFSSLGFNAGDMPTVVALLVFSDALGPLTAILQLVQNLIVRSCEYDADRFSVRLGYGENLKTALVNLNKSNLSSVDADRLYSTFYHSHPILPERLRAINEEMDVKKSAEKKRQ